jgi:sulfur-oxidizing protein SoxY
LLAVFRLSPASGRAEVSARIRLAESQIVVAMAEMSDGSWYIGRAPAKVAIGGCGSGVAGPTAAQAIGDPRVRLPQTVPAGEAFEIKTLIAHPMQTGRLTDATGTPIPRQIIGRFSCLSASGELFGAGLGTGMAANPYLAFHARLERSTALEFVWTEEAGRTFRARQIITVVT